VVTRAVPVLAEASVLFAGISGMSMHPLLLLPAWIHPSVFGHNDSDEMET
jgi:hypothetical protein